MDADFELSLMHRLLSCGSIAVIIAYKYLNVPLLVFLLSSILFA